MGDQLGTQISINSLNLKLPYYFQSRILTCIAQNKQNICLKGEGGEGGFIDHECFTTSTSKLKFPKGYDKVILFRNSHYIPFCCNPSIPGDMN